MKNLIIIGARGFGREIYHMASQCPEFNVEWTIKGFLDDKVDALNGFNYPVGILSSVEAYEIQKEDVFVCALGDVAFKQKYVDIIKSKGGSFVSLIHPTALVNTHSILGQGLIICAFSYVGNDSRIGDFVTVQPFCAIGHDVVIGDWCHLNSYSFIGGYSTVGHHTTLNTKSTILPKLNIGSHSIVGAGSVVLRNVRDNITVFGNPAKELKF